jgi:hypothetical protein
VVQGETLPPPAESVVLVNNSHVQPNMMSCAAGQTAAAKPTPKLGGLTRKTR